MPQQFPMAERKERRWLSAGIGSPELGRNNPEELSRAAESQNHQQVEPKQRERRVDGDQPKGLGKGIAAASRCLFLPSRLARWPGQQQQPRGLNFRAASEKEERLLLEGGEGGERGRH